MPSGQENQQLQRVTARSISLSSAPDPAGSSVPPLVTATNTVPTRQQRSAPLSTVCTRCGLNHLLEVCQEREPWEYVATYYGSEEFGSGFYSIPAAELESPPS
jgi:hypothetical protein